MKKIKIVCLVVFLPLVILSCERHKYEERIELNYFLISLEEFEDMSLMIKNDNLFVEVIPQTVYALGSDKNYIIVKRHPREWPSMPDKSIKQYYIIPITEPVDEVAEYNRIGPMTKEEFERKREELRVPQSLTFTKVFENLE
ncbi:DUF3997 domain-containing protein [Fulvivirga imtechensis]|nr:DUF3997 domain-containing protein [Fulvivirga imtechensis]